MTVQQETQTEAETPQAETPTLLEMPDMTPKATNDDDDDDDDVTVILMDDAAQNGDAGAVALDWIEQQGPEMEERRRTILLRELQRTQRVSCCHFVLLCSVPVILLIIVLSAILGEQGECNSDVTYCEFEERSFSNAFTTRCICDPIPISRNNLAN